MADFMLKDTSGDRCCPYCRDESLRFVRVPEHRREWVNEDGENVIEHMPAMLDYACDDCGAKWILPEDQDDFR